MKLLFGSLVCLVLIVGCGGGSPTAKSEANVEARVTQESTDNPLPTREAKTSENIKAAVSTPVTAATAVPVIVSTLVPDMDITIEPASQNDAADGDAIYLKEKSDDDDVSGVDRIDLDGNPNDTEQCENATGEMVQKCMDQASAMIDEDPKLCETATGMMAFMCQNRAKESESTTHESGGSGGSGSGADGGGAAQIANPCDKVAEAFRPQCEESIRSDPNSAFYDGSSVGNFAENFDPDNIPQIAKSNFTELDKFSRMSKLRSVVGHDYAFDTTEFDPDGLSCRSMKHYFVPAGVPRDNMLYASTPHTFEWMSIKFFAPTDGVIKNVIRTTNEYGPEAQFAITSNAYPGYLFNYYHVKLLPDLDTGSAVTAGQQIGTLGAEDSWGEIGVQVQISAHQNHLLSFLQVATDEVLEEYKASGLNTVSDAIITKEQRDANPIGCEVNSEARWFQGSGRGGTVLVEAFVIWAFESADNWFFFD